MKHNRTFTKLASLSALAAIICVLAFIAMTSCSKAPKPYCVCTDIWSKATYQHPEATTNDACDLARETVHRNQDVTCIIK